jgi:hypothetical protein
MQGGLGCDMKCSTWKHCSLIIRTGEFSRRFSSPVNFWKGKRDPQSSGQNWQFLKDTPGPVLPSQN